MESARGPAESLNSSQRLHLLSSCRYADQLFSEIESILTASSSKSPFPKYRPDLTPAQAKVVQDYIARLRAQMVRLLASQGITPPEAQFGSIHSIRVTLGFADIACEECRPKSMRGYGELPESLVADLNGLVDELQGLIAKLDSYLAQGLGQDLGQRLERLERAGAEVGLVRTLERIISERGLVEFRPTLSAIVDRLESDSFEIAVFGRVSSGKSSLLNYVLQTDVLPVGVTPITAVPTRIVHGTQPRGRVWFADRRAEEFPLERLSEFVSEQLNPGNIKHVTRIVLELPSPRLREGVIFVDTPGLGSLATAGAAETTTYLPRCDLGVVLVDAGSTLSPEDLSTVQALYEAAIPACVLLSKADLLAPADREHMLRYVSDHLRSDLGLTLTVHPVSIKPGCGALLEEWFQREILPLYDQRLELSRRSLRRKTGALLAAVEAALKARLQHSGRTAAVGSADLQKLETELRKMAGKFSEARAACLRITDEIRELARPALREAAHALVEQWRRAEDSSRAAELTRTALEQAAAEQAGSIAAILKDLARESSRVLEQTARGLNLEENAPGEAELLGALTEMPRLDAGAIEARLRAPRLILKLGARGTRWWVERRLGEQIGEPVSAALASYAKILEAWVRRKYAELQSRFDSYADAYRAQFDRLANSQAASSEEQAAIRGDLETLAAFRTESANVGARREIRPEEQHAVP